MSATEPVRLSLHASGVSARVVGFERGTVFAETALPVTGPDSPAFVSFRQGDVGATIDLKLEPLPLEEDASRPGTAYRVLGPSNAIVVLGRMAAGAGKDRFRPALSLDVPPRPPRAPKAGRDRRLVAAFFAATLVFGTLSIRQLEARLFTFPAEIARIASDGDVVRADKAGRLVFITDNKDVSAGEPVAGIRTRSGYEQPFLAPRDGHVSAVLARSGDSVTVGDPVMVVSPPHEKPYVVARIRIADAVRLSDGYDAVMTFGGGENRRVAVGPRNVLPVGNSGSSSRVDVRIEAGDGLDGRVGEPVSVRFVATGKTAPTPDAPDGFDKLASAGGL